MSYLPFFCLAGAQYLYAHIKTASMKDMQPYLHFTGAAEAAMKFYKKIFGGEFLTFTRFKDIPGGEKMSPEDQEKFVHINLAIGNGLNVMATDMPATKEHLVIGNNYHICINTDSEEETDRLFNELSEDGKIDMPMNRTFWGAYFGMCRDKFGIQWMLNYQAPNQ